MMRIPVTFFTWIVFSIILWVSLWVLLNILYVILFWSPILSETWFVGDILWNIISVLVLLVLGIFYPLVYLFTLSPVLVEISLTKLWWTYRDVLFGLIVEKLAHMLWIKREEGLGRVVSREDFLSRFPWVLRVVIRWLLSKLPFASIVEEAMAQLDEWWVQSEEELTAYLMEHVEGLKDEHLPIPSLKGLIMWTNIGLAVLVGVVLAI